MAARLILVVVAIAIAVVALLIIKPGSDDSSSTTQSAAPPATTTTTTTTTTVEPGEQATTTTTTTTAPAPAPKVTVIRTKDEKPVDGITKITVDKGDTIRFTVTSNVPEEAHFHGYDIAKDIGPGQPARFVVPATIVGRFEVELEHAGVQIADISVEP